MCIKSRYQFIKEYLDRDIVTTKKYTDIKVYVNNKLSNFDIINTIFNDVRVGIIGDHAFVNIRIHNRNYIFTIDRSIKCKVLRDYINNKYKINSPVIIFAGRILRDENVIKHYDFSCITMLHCLNNKNKQNYINEHQYLKLEPKIESLKIFALNYIFNNIKNYNINILPYDVKKYLVKN